MHDICFAVSTVSCTVWSQLTNELSNAQTAFHLIQMLTNYVNEQVDFKITLLTT